LNLFGFREVPHPLAPVTDIDPDEIPKDPPNRFLMRAQDADKDKIKDGEKKDKEKKREKRSRSRSRERNDRRRESRDSRDGRNPRYGTSHQVDNSGRKIKGRGRVVILFHYSSSILTL